MNCWVPSCVVEGTIDGLAPGEHGLALHEAGDVSQGCASLGDHYNPRFGSFLDLLKDLLFMSIVF